VRLHLADKIKMCDEDEGVTAAWRRLIIINYSCEMLLSLSIERRDPNTGSGQMKATHLAMQNS